MPDTSATSSGQIFISYRRQETAYAAGWLYDRLAHRFGADKIFKDIDSIELGDDFVQVIATAVGSCDVLLALIGDDWLTITGADGRRRLDDPADFVRVEIEAALARNVRVIPVLVDGASMPNADALPESLTKLVRRHALELSPDRFDFDTGRLLRALEGTLAEVQAEVAATPPPPPTPTVPPKARSSGRRGTLGKQLAGLSTRSRIVAVEAALAVLLLLLFAAVVNTNDTTSAPSGSSTSTPSGTTRPPNSIEIPTGTEPFRIAATDDGVWVTANGGTTVHRIDPDTDTGGDPIELGGEPVGIDANLAGVWVSDYTNGAVHRIETDTNQVASPSFDVGEGPRNVSATETAVWVANLNDDTVSRIDVASGDVQSIAVGDGPRGIAATDSDVWVTNTEGGTVSHIDIGTGNVETITTGGRPGGVALTADAVWVADSSQNPGQIIKINPATDSVVDSVEVGTHPGDMASTDDTVYVSNSGDDTVYAIDAATGAKINEFPTGPWPDGLAVTDTDLWVANKHANTVSRIPLD